MWKYAFWKVSQLKKTYHYISIPIAYIVQDTKPSGIMTEITSQVKTNVSGSHHIHVFGIFQFLPKVFTLREVRYSE